MAPTLPSAQVYDDDAIAAFGGGVGDVRHAAAARCELRSQIESNVVEIRVRVGYGWREDDGLDNGIVGQGDADEFGAARRSGN
jgi:hypothetical protein